MANKERAPEGHGDGLSELERALASIKPQPGRLSRGQLMFLAGQASVRPETLRATKRTSWYWPASTAAMTAVSAALVLVVVLRSGPEKVREVVYVDRPQQSAPVTPTAEFPDTPSEPRPEAGDIEKLPRDYLDMRDNVLAFGVDALPALSLQGSPPGTSREMLQSVLSDGSYRRAQQPDERGRFNWKSILRVGELL